MNKYADSKTLFIKTRIAGMLLCFAAVMCAFLPGCRKDAKEAPTEIVFWHSYRDDQAAILGMLAETYNTTEGRHRNTHVTLEYKTDEEITDILNDSFQSGDTYDYPSVSVVDDEVAYKAMARDLIVPAERYLTYDELSGYFKGFMNEGKLMGTDDTYIFPLTKITALTLINDAGWRYFSLDCNADADEWRTWEGIADISGQYYAWSGGRAMLAIESVQDYIFTYSAQRLPAIIQAGNKEIKINTNKETLRYIWDFYYNGVISGYILQTDDIMGSLEKGDIIAYIGKPEGSASYPRQFENYKGGISTFQLNVLPYPSVNESRVIAPHSGKGAIVFDRGDRANKEAYTFLHWLSSNEYSVELGAAGTEIAAYKGIYSTDGAGDYMRRLMLSDYTGYTMVSVSVDQAVQGSTYAPTAFEGYESFCTELTSSLIDAAREGREAVLKMTADGVSYEEAVCSIDTDKAFEEWYSYVKQLASGY